MSFVHHADEAGGPANSRPPPRRNVLTSALAALIKYWALVGGVILLALVLMTAVSAVSNLFLHKPIPGDYELVKHFIAIAIFTFLPYCQLTGANVTVDIFTEGMSDRAKSAMRVFSSLLAIVLAIVLLRQMSLGFADYVRFPEETATLHVPLWTAFPPMLFSLALLLIAGVITAADGISGMRQRLEPPHEPVVAK